MQSSEQSNAYWLPKVKIIDAAYNPNTEYCIGINDGKLLIFKNITQI